MPHIMNIETARSFLDTESLCILVAPEEPPFPSMITMPLAVVAVTVWVVGVALVGDAVTVLKMAVKPNVVLVLVVLMLTVAPPLSVPVQLVPDQQQATCPAQS